MKSILLCFKNNFKKLIKTKAQQKLLKAHVK